MSDAPLLAALYSPDPDIGGLTRSLRALFAAILARALKDIFKPAHGDHEIYKAHALYWISIDDPDSFTSFTSICSYLDIDADEIRHKVNVQLGKMEPEMAFHIPFNIGDHKLKYEDPGGLPEETIVRHSCWS